MTSARAFALICLASLGTIAPARAQDVACTSPMVMLDQGWWLRAREDGPTTIGYGALPQTLPVAAGVIDAKGVCALIAEHVRPWQPKGERAADEHYFDVTFGTGGGLVRDIDEEIYARLYELFRRAYRNVDESSEPVLGDAETVRRAWREAFFISGP